ncbi:unnamed protein product, partial [Polarella glacialis]
ARGKNTSEWQQYVKQALETVKGKCKEQASLGASEASVTVFEYLDCQRWREAKNNAGLSMRKYVVDALQRDLKRMGFTKHRINEQPGLGGCFQVTIQLQWEVPSSEPPEKKRRV